MTGNWEVMFPFVFYSLNSFAFLHSIYFDIIVVDYPGKTVLETVLKLTFLNQSMNGIYWTLRCLLAIKKFKADIATQFIDCFLLSLILPTGILVACMYWAIRLYDYDLLITPLQKYYVEVGILRHPWWHNHTIHTLVLISPLIEVIYLIYQQKLAVIKNSHLVLAQLSQSTVFVTVVLYYALVHDYWAYPLFAQLGIFYTIIFGCFMSALNLLVAISVKTAVAQKLQPSSKFADKYE